MKSGFFVKLFSVLTIFSLVVPFNFAQAFLVPTPAVSQPAVGTGETNTVGQTFLNSLGTSTTGSISSDREGKAPRADVVITPTNPKAGESIYAQALPQNFRNSQAKLYYNWYIYNADPKVGSTVVKDGKKIFIPSNSLEGALIRGAMAQARGNYVPGVSKKAKDAGIASEDANSDRDGQSARYGGDDGKGAVEEKINKILGDDYDLDYGDLESNCKNNCEDEYDKAKSEAEWDYKKCYEPACSDWSSSCCSACEEDYNKCIQDVWDENKDNCFADICDKDEDEEQDNCLRGLSESDYAICDEGFFDDESDCSEERNLCCINKGACGAKPSQDCTECEKDYNRSIWEKEKTFNYCKSKCELKEGSSPINLSNEPVGSRCFRYNFGGKTGEDRLMGIFQPISCTHYFPGSRDPESIYDWEKIIPFKTGDGEFKEAEEIFWGTDPTNSDTDGDGFLDEADILGLGQQTIKYEYKAGDKIGVVVEGTSLFPTNEKTPFYKIMWAFGEVCGSDSFYRTKKDYPGFNSLCTCEKEKDGKCEESKDFGFGSLGLKDIWQRVDGEQTNKLDAMIFLNPLKPSVGKELILEGVSAGESISKDLLIYQWKLKHEGEVLKVEKDTKNSRLIWKKQGVDVAFTPLENSLADFKEEGGVGWKDLKLIPLLEGKFTAVLKITEILDTKQIMGESAYDFSVSSKLKLRFFRAELKGNNFEKKDEFIDREITTGDFVLVEYEGTPYEDFLWSIDRVKLEDNAPKIIFKADKAFGADYKIELTASNKSHTNVVNDDAVLKVVTPYVSLQPRKIESSKADLKAPAGKIFEVFLNEDLEFETILGPVGSTFATKGEVEYFWSLDQNKFEKGENLRKLNLSGKQYTPKSFHSLQVRVTNKEGVKLAEDQVSLTINPESMAMANNKEKTVAGLAFAYLNLSDNLKFILENIVWVIFIYLLLSSLAWLSNKNDSKIRP